MSVATAKKTKRVRLTIYLDPETEQRIRQHRTDERCELSDVVQAAAERFFAEIDRRRRNGGRSAS